MRLRLLSSLLIACTLTLGACATVTPEHVPLAPAARSAMTTTEVVAPIKQSEIYVFVPPSQMAAAGGGGLLLALIDAGVDATRTHNAEEAVKPLRDAVVDYNFDETLRGNLQQSLSQVDWLKVDGVRVTKDIAPAAIDKAIVDSKQGAVLVTSADYQLSNDASTLTVTVWADLYANSDALRALKPAKGGNAKILSAPGNALYRNRITVISQLPGATTDRPSNIAAWSANKGQILRDSLSDASKTIASTLASDLGGTPAVVAAQ